MDARARLIAELATQIFTRGYQANSQVGAVTVGVTTADAANLAEHIIRAAEEVVERGFAQPRRR